MRIKLVNAESLAAAELEKACLSEGAMVGWPFSNASSLDGSRVVI
jgi:hypothetical protein